MLHRLSCLCLLGVKITVVSHHSQVTFAFGRVCKCHWVYVILGEAEKVACTVEAELGGLFELRSSRLAWETVRPCLKTTPQLNP